MRGGKQAKKRYRVPDTAHDCPILRIGVVHGQPVSERKNLWNGVFSFLPQSVPAPQNHCHLHLGLITKWGNVAQLISVHWWGDDRQVSQSGKPLCTGASLWAVPKLARGLRPLEPRHVNGVSIPAKCPPDIPTEHLLIDQDSVLHLYKRALHSLINLLQICTKTLCLLIKNENQVKKGDKSL